jgi:hypothetical protein
VKIKRMYAAFITAFLGLQTVVTGTMEMVHPSVVYAENDTTIRKIKDFRFVRFTPYSVEFEWQWRENTEEAVVEVRKVNSSSGNYVKREIQERRMRCDDLSPDTEYEIWFNNEKYLTFRTVDDWYDRYYDDRYYYEDGYYYDGRWYYYNDDRYAYDAVIDSKSDTHVDISWRGTSKNVYVELRKRNSGSTVSGKWANRSTSFTGLSSDTEYSVYIEGRYMTSFRTEKTSEARDVSIQKNTANQSVDITWQGTSGSVEVTLKKGGTQVQSKSTNDRKVSFYGLERNQDYYLYIGGKYIQTFSLPSYYEIYNPSSNTWEPTGAIWVPPTSSGIPTIYFSDIQGHWAKDAIERLASYGIVSGFKGGIFKPDKQVSREEFIVMLVMAQKYSTANYGMTGFSDIQTNRWSAPYIAAAVENGIIIPKEYYGTRFVGQKPITREEAAVMLARALKLKPSTESLLFSDTYAIKNQGLVGAVVREGIMTGLPNNRFNPNGFLTRAAAAVMLNEIFKAY